MNARTDQFIQLAREYIWDGDLISKPDRDVLCKDGMVQRAAGFNWLTPKGVEFAVAMGWITDDYTKQLKRMNNNEHPR